MDKMREDFEAWFKAEKASLVDEKYQFLTKEIMFEGWQASRAALCVELSDLEFSTDRSGDGGIMLSERVFEALKKAGVPYK